MNGSQYETVAILAGLIQKARLYNTDQFEKITAVPVTDIAAALEKFTTTQTAPSMKRVRG